MDPAALFGFIAQFSCSLKCIKCLAQKLAQRWNTNIKAKGIAILPFLLIVQHRIFKCLATRENQPILSMNVPFFPAH